MDADFYHCAIAAARIGRRDTTFWSTLVRKTYPSLFSACSRSIQQFSISIQPTEAASTAFWRKLGVHPRKTAQLSLCQRV